MKKYLSLTLLSVFALAAIAYPVSVFAQDSISIKLPLKFDFSNASVALSSATLITSTFIALVAGYVAPIVPMIKNISSKKWQVFSVIVPLLIVISIFGFKGDTVSVLINTLWGLFSANGVYQYGTQPIAQSLYPSEEAVVSQNMKDKEQKRSSMNL